MFKYNRAQLPTTFNNFCIKASDVHHYATKSTYKQTYYVPKFTLVKFQKILSIQVAKYRMISQEENPRGKPIYHFLNLKKFTKQNY